MEMLRQWNGESNKLLVQHLLQFGVDAGKVWLIKYEELTPDSFIWFLHVKEKGKTVVNRYLERVHPFKVLIPVIL